MLNDMVGYLHDFFRQVSPDYRSGFKDGFKVAQDQAERRVKNLLREIKDLEAYATSTSSSETL